MTFWFRRYCIFTKSTHVTKASIRVTEEQWEFLQRWLRKAASHWLTVGESMGMEAVTVSGWRGNSHCAVEWVNFCRIICQTAKGSKAKASYLEKLHLYSLLQRRWPPKKPLCCRAGVRLRDLSVHEIIQSAWVSLTQKSTGMESQSENPFRAFQVVTTLEWLSF